MHMHLTTAPLLGGQAISFHLADFSNPMFFFFFLPRDLANELKTYIFFFFMIIAKPSANHNPLPSEDVFGGNN